MIPRLFFRRLFTGIAAFVALMTIASPAYAWWDYGHATVARIAMMEVRPSTRAAILRMLARSSMVETPECRVRTIEDASTWPDCIKRYGDRFSYASSWHYQNIGICGEFTLRGNCPDGNCVSAQITRAWRILKTPGVPERERIMALMFMIHFVGDLHMPLHAGDNHDLGGNRVRSGYGPIPYNLHSIWDGLLAERAISTPVGGPAGILAEVPVGERAAMAAGTVEDWSRESWLVSRDTVYPAVFDHPCATPAETPRALTQAQVVQLIPVVRQQIARGGLRLARLLDEAFDGTPLPPRPPREG